MDNEQLSLWGSESTGDASLKTVSEALVGYDIIDITSEAIIAAPKQLAEVDLRELGTSSPSPWTSWMRYEYNAELRGRAGLEKYDKMRRSDSTVRSALRLIKTPVLAARWYIEPASDSTRDKNVAEFIWKNLTEWMTISWSQVLIEAMLSLDFGYYMFEKVFAPGDEVTNDADARGKVVWQKLAPRHPMDVIQWDYDIGGGPDGVVMYHEESPVKEVFIPIDKLLVFTFDKEAGNMEGISVLRSAYRNWYYKENLYKIDAIAKERHGIGIPIIKLPPNFTPSDKTLAEQLGRNLRTNEKAHVVLPPLWEIEFAKLEGNPVDAMKSAEHHDHAINKNILAGFIDDEGSSKEDDQQLFIKASRFVADLVCECFNKYAIPQLVDINWSRVGYPQLKFRRLGNNIDARVFSFAIRNMVGADIITPDDKLEEWVREEMDLPKHDPETARVPMEAGGPEGEPEDTNLPKEGAPQNPGTPRVGMPRQSTARNMRIGPGNNGRVGRDTSGG